MNILNLIQCSNLGGMEWATLRLMQNFLLYSSSITIHSLNKAGPIAPLIKRSGIKFSHSNYTRYYNLKNLIHTFYDIRKKIKIADVVFVTGLTLVSILAVRKDNFNKNILAVHFHHEGVKSRLIFNLLYRLANYKFSLITFPSQYVLNEAIGLCPLIKNKSIVAPNILPDYKYRKTANSSSNRINIGNGGWLIKRKRFDIFIRVIKELNLRGYDVMGYIAGDGDQLTNLIKLADDLNISSKIVWMGEIKDMEKLYEKIDLLLFSTDFDALPTTPIEALVCNIPVVASSAKGGIGEYLIEGFNGFLINSHDISKLADRCIDAFNSTCFSNIASGIQNTFDRNSIFSIYKKHLGLD